MADIQENILSFVEKIKEIKDRIHNEESTKQCLILPFLDILGYDTRNPLEVIPEYVSDMVSKKERVDYCICRDGQPLFFVEAKAYKEDLDKPDAQLSRYFNASPNIKVALLSDGIFYKAFTDLIHPNIMDAEPFYTFDMENLGSKDLFFIQKISKLSFSKNQLFDFAEAQRAERKLERALSPDKIKRRRRGRPKTIEPVRMHISVERNLYLELDNFLMEHGIAPSKFFCDRAREYLEEHG